jgi:hypothetical protein
MSYAKVIHKMREKKKNEKKWTQKCPRYLKQWYFDAHLKKEMNKISPAL